MSLNGNLQDFELTEVLQLMSRGQHTGLLTVSVQRETEHGSTVPTVAKIYFHAGKVEEPFVEDPALTVISPIDNCRDRRFDAD